MTVAQDLSDSLREIGRATNLGVAMRADYDDARICQSARDKLEQFERAAIGLCRSSIITSSGTERANCFSRVATASNSRKRA